MAESSFQKRINNSNNDGVQVEEGRLSTLPEIVLVEILSRLPLKSAAATTGLSKYWRSSHFWTQHPHFFDSASWQPADAASSSQMKSCIKFIDTVHRILQNNKSPVIQTFNISIPDPGSEIELCTEKLNSLIKLISTQNVVAIKVILEPLSDLIERYSVPSCIFNIESLVELHLGEWVICELPVVTEGVVSLPNLKKLDLGWKFCLDDFPKLWALIKSCPNLEFLSLNLFHCRPKFVNISSSKLKSLIVKGIRSRGAKFELDTPMLKNLSLKGFIGYYTFVRFPSELIKVELSFWDDMDGITDLYAQIQPLFQKISGVQSVILDHYLSFFEALKCWDAIDFGSIFRNVTHLRLNGDAIGGGFDDQNPIPLYLFTNLKILELELTARSLNADNMKLLHYILSQANDLERFRVLSVYNGLDDINDSDDEEDRNKDTLWWEHKVYQTLLNLPMSSLPFQLDFVGIFIHVSSDRSQNGPHPGTRARLV